MTDNVFLADQEQQRRQPDFLLATIVSADDTAGTAKIRLDGMTDPNEKSYKALGSAWPLTAGDRVVLLKQSGTYLILGRIGKASGGGEGPEPSTSLPLMDGTASAGAAETYARGDHVHPKDSSIPETYAAAKSAGGPADKALAIPVAEIDSSSTTSAFVVTVAEFEHETTLRDGLIFLMRFTGKATAARATLNVNGTGAKPIYIADGSQVLSGTIPADRTCLMSYNTTILSTGCWLASFLTDTLYYWRAASEGGASNSLVTTGEKYTWNQAAALVSEIATGTKGSINVNSTSTLEELGIITESGAYVLFMQEDSAGNSTASAYFVRKHTAGTPLYSITPIVEGTSYFAPRLSDAGVLTLNTSTYYRSINWMWLRIKSY